MNLLNTYIKETFVDKVPIEPSVAREKLDCIARKNKVINDAFDHLRDGMPTLALRVLAEELGIK